MAKFGLVFPAFTAQAEFIKEIQRCAELGGKLYGIAPANYKVAFAVYLSR